MTRIGNNFSASISSTNNLKTVSKSADSVAINPSAFASADVANLLSKKSISTNPFGSNNNLKGELIAARKNNDAGEILRIAKIQLKDNVIPGEKASDLFREAYNVASSEMDSDTLYALANFDALNDVLPDVSSEHLFKLADLARQIY